VLYAIPADATGLPKRGDPLPVGAKQGTNDWDKVGWGGPCPPIGEHRYFFKLYALDVALGDLSEPSKAELEDAMTGHILAQTELVGVYEKQRP
jgi:Raf kinase inhibitor-like YbhB/YbcL family protein